MSLVDIRCGTYAGYRAHLRRKDEACRPCLDATKERSRNWQIANPEKIKAYKQKWESENRLKLRPQKAKAARKRRAKEYNNGYENYTEQQVIELYGVTCYLCDEQVDLEASRQSGAQGWETGLHIDHLVPVSKGGPDTLENVRPTHGKCNLRKGHTMPLTIGKNNDES